MLRHIVPLAIILLGVFKCVAVSIFLLALRLDWFDLWKGLV